MRFEATRIFSPSELKQTAEWLDAFRLSTGAVSDYCFDCKRATLYGDTLQLIAEEFIARIQELPLQPSAVAGLALGANPLVAAIIMRAKKLGLSIVHGSAYARSS